MGAAVVIVSYRPGPWLEPAVASAAEQAEQVVLVDNGSEGAAASAVARRLGVDLVRLEKNVGFPAGVNAGMAKAKGDVLAVLNDDAIAEPGWLARSEEVLGDPDVAAVAPKLLLASPFAEIRFPDERQYFAPDPRSMGRMLHEVTIDGRDVLPSLLGGIHRVEDGDLAGRQRRWRWTSGPDAIYVPLEREDDADRIVVDGEPVRPDRLVRLVNSAGSYLSREGHGGDRGWLAPDDGSFDEPEETFGACGAALVFTRATWQRVGPLAASFFAYYEDLDWCWRARLGGQTIRYEPAATVRHIRSASSGGEEHPNVRLMSGRNRLHTLARNAPMSVVRRQLERTAEPDHPADLHRLAKRRVIRGVTDRARLRLRWKLRPEDVWEAWAGVGERWGPEDGEPSAEANVPPRVRFGD